MGGRLWRRNRRMAAFAGPICGPWTRSRLPQRSADGTAMPCWGRKGPNRSWNGVEVKLVDRVRALETLWKLLEASEPQQADPLLQALAALPGETGDWNEK